MNHEAYTIRLELPAHSRFLPLLGTTINLLITYIQEMVSVEESEMIGYELEMAAHEVCMNIIDHAYKNERCGSIRLTFSAQPANNELIVVLIDSGETFNPQLQAWPPPSSWQLSTEPNERQYQLTAVPEPTLDQERGRGLYLITKLVDSVHYVPLEDGNRWRLTKSVKEEQDGNHSSC